jgi:serine/threonine protein kinase HipA of HipAB toxin-antitoxin module
MACASGFGSDVIRKRVAQRFKIGSTDPFDLLQAIGRDCVGAVQLLGEDDTPEGVDRIDGSPLSDSQIERHLLDTVTYSNMAAGQVLDDSDDFRISLAGAQEKTALLYWRGQWWMRLPQEDFCQVEACPLWHKYENDGGPGLKALFTTLRQSIHAEADMRTLMAAQVLFWLLRATDGHAKNFSIQLLPQGRFQLTKLYDIMSAYPVMGHGPNQWPAQSFKLAMALLGKNRHYGVQGIQRRHFNSTAQHVGYADSAEPIIQGILAQTPQVITQVSSMLPEGFSQQVADTVLGGLEQAAKALEAMPAN